MLARARARAKLVGVARAKTIRAKVKAGHLEKYNEKEFILLDSSVTVDFFDSNEQHTSILNSNKAEVNQRSNDMKAIGNVVAVSDSGISLYSETLVWDSKNEKLRTKDKIMITTLDQDTLYGIGFESDSDLENCSEYRTMLIQAIHTCS